MSYCFSRSSVKFQGHMAKKFLIVSQIGFFRKVTPVWIHRWVWNDAQNLKYHRRGALLFFKVIHQISRSRGTKNCQFDPSWEFRDCYSSFNLPMATQWCPKLEVAYNRCPIVFQGHPSNFKVTQDRKLLILTWIESFWTVNPVSIHRWL